MHRWTALVRVTLYPDVYRYEDEPVEAMSMNLTLSIISTLATIGLLGVAFHGLRATARQLEGSTLYALAKDGRELTAKRAAHEVKAGQVLSYFFSARQLRRLGVIRESSWVPLRKALSEFLKKDPEAVQEWESYKELYDDDFNKLVRTLREASKCPTP